MLRAGLMLAFLACVVGAAAFLLLARDVYVVQSPSMKPTLRPGDVVVVKPLDGLVEPGQVITYEVQGKLITHRVVRVEGDTVYTKGDAADEEDAWRIDRSAIRGQMDFRIPYGGYVILFLRQPLGFLSVLALPVLLFLGIEGGKRREKRRPGKRARAQRTTGAVSRRGGGTGALLVFLAMIGALALLARGGRRKTVATKPAKRSVRPAKAGLAAAALVVVAGCLAGALHVGGVLGFFAGTSDELLTISTAPSFEPIAATISKDLIAVADADDDGNIEVGERVQFTLLIAVKNVSTDQTVTNAVVSDAFGAELEIVDTDPSQGTASISTKGGSDKPFLTWDIGTLGPGEGATLTVVAATDINPGGHQEYSEAGAYELNSGATLKALSDGKQFSATSEVIWVEVVEANAGESQGSNPIPSPVAITGDTSEYQVQPGDTLIDIAAGFGTTVEALGELNGLEDPGVILYGSTLTVPYVGEDAGDATADVSR